MDELKHGGRAGERRVRARGGAVALAVLLGGGYAALRLMDGLLHVLGVG